MSQDFKVDGQLGALTPGVTPRRYEPPGGTTKHNERIHRESDYADKYKSLPFEFSKPSRAGRRSLFKCAECGYMSHLSVNAVGLICPECKKFVKVEEVVDDE